MKNDGKGSRVKVPTGLEQPWVAKNDQVTVGGTHALPHSLRVVSSSKELLSLAVLGVEVRIVRKL